MDIRAHFVLWVGIRSFFCDENKSSPWILIGEVQVHDQLRRRFSLLAWSVLPSFARQRKRTCMLQVDVRNTRDGIDVVVIHSVSKPVKVHTRKADYLL